MEKLSPDPLPARSVAENRFVMPGFSFFVLSVSGTGKGPEGLRNSSMVEAFSVVCLQADGTLTGLSYKGVMAT